jgi:hypothetical protein
MFEKQVAQKAHEEAQKIIEEHEAAPEGIEFYKAMDWLNKRKIESLAEELKRLRNELRDLEKENIENVERIKVLEKEVNDLKKEKKNYFKGAKITITN